MEKSVKINQRLKSLLRKSNLTKDVVQTIRGSAYVYDLVKEGSETKLPIDCDIVDEFRKRYFGLSFNQLLLLWHENYHTLSADNRCAINNKELAPQSLATYMTANKMIAIGMLLHEGW